ncbi:type VI secretion IcmF C-terminal domain-containing protein [Hyalangium rubrum]|uniref:Type VI secretion IcmF C-terminal domain-containing protein n=1 Tax=Hyalangium rubrum TaxID=3103134 RepID=A0ABU5HIU1_9BACT|nr:type VI secretion IcmF C-terminal domain-containing protein [Hyalangium sp. s54d21]MDY7233077.1 type VI secretion IcmF C-terminal domain-containing protein [Hyalangium sp. s54d21]
MGALQNIWTAVRPHLGWILLVLGILLVVVLALTAKKWRPKLQKWLKGLKGGAATEGEALHPRRLVGTYKRFLRALPWRYRSAVVDFPAVVVLGPAGSGKAELIGLEVDWQRQKRQFMPSYEEDPLVKIYLGPESVVQKISSSLLGNITPEAEEALRKLWKESIGRNKRALAVIVLDANWLRERPPDEIREFTHLLRGKLNLISDVCKAPVETRVCLTHMDTLPGFADFAKLLRGHGVSLDMEVPAGGEERRLADHLKRLEEHLALGLTALPVEAFERLEAFYSGLGKAFEGLIRFVSGLREGGSLSFPPNLTRVYLSTLSPESRAMGSLAVQTEKKVQQLQSHYRWVHLRRCAIILALGCLPVLAAYVNFYRVLGNAWDRVNHFEQMAERLKEEGIKPEGELVDREAAGAMVAMEKVWASSRYWPPLRKSFQDDQRQLRAKLAGIIREAYLQPLFEHCREVCASCNEVPGCSAQPKCKNKQAKDTEYYHYAEDCRPEQMLYMQAILNASRGDALGDFILGSLDSSEHGKWNWAQEALELHHQANRGSDQNNWMDRLGVVDAIAGIYVINSDKPWDAEDPENPAEGDWYKWPYQNLTFKDQIAPWWRHFDRLKAWLEEEELDLEEWERLQAERAELLVLLESAQYYSEGELQLERLNASPTSVKQGHLAGVKETLRALAWMRENHEALQAVLALEEEAGEALYASHEMSDAQLLTQANGLFVPKAGDVVFEISAPDFDTFDLSTMTVSERLLDKLELQVKQSERLAFDQPRGDSAEGTVVPVGGAVGEDGEVVEGVGVPSGPLVSRKQFDTEIKPLVDEFTQRLDKSNLTPEKAATQETFLLGKMKGFSQNYSQSLFAAFRGYKFEAPAGTLRAELGALSQPSSNLADMLRDVSDRASIGPLDSRFYEPLRKAIEPFKPIVQLMAPDKDGKTPAFDEYRLLVSQLHGELAGSKPASKAPAAKAPAGKAETEKAEAGAVTEEAPGAQLAELLSPLGRVALAMSLEEEGSYLAKVDVWLEQQGILGEFRVPFRKPFLDVRERGMEEVNAVVREQWNTRYKRFLEPLVKRYPFDPNAQQEIDPSDLEVLRRKDGEFWQFIDQVLSPLLVERGSEWALRRPLRKLLAPPPRMLSTLEQMARLSRTLWDEQGKPVPLALQVRPLPLPRLTAPGDFVTRSYFKCGGASAFGFNQSPTWQDFPLNWWDQRTASLGVELGSPKREGKRYRTVEMARSSWSCFRLLELGTLTEEQNMVWALPGPDGDTSAQLMEVSFGLRGKPWAAFRRDAK